MKRVLFCFGALLCVTQCAWSMDWGSKKGYEKIPSPQEKQHPYCHTNSCAKDNHDDDQTLRNLLNDLQSTLLIEAKLCENNPETTLVAHDTMICDLSAGNHHQTTEILSEPDPSYSINAQVQPTIAITKAEIDGKSALIYYRLQTKGKSSERSTSINIDQATQIPLEKDFIIKLSAYLASSKPNGTRK